MEQTEIRCPNCNCSNLSIAHLCVRCGNQLTPLVPSTYKQHHQEFSWDLIYEYLLHGHGDELGYALSVIQQTKYPQLIPLLVTLYQGRHPSTNKKVNVDETHKGAILLALGLIGTDEVGKTIARLAEDNPVEFMLEAALPILATYAAAICEPTVESIQFILKQFSSYNMMVKHLACETLKKYGSPELFKDLFEFTISDLNLPDSSSNVGYYGSSLLGIAVSATQFAVGMNQESRISALMNNLIFTQNASPALLSALSADLQRCWSQQRRIEVFESITRRYGVQAFTESLKYARKGHEKFLAACVIARLYPDPKDWMQTIIAPINGAWLTTPVASRLTAYDTLIRLHKVNPNSQTEQYILSGLKHNQPIVRGAVANSILIHGLENFYPAVFNLANDSKIDVRISLVYGVTMLQANNPPLATNILQSMAAQNSDKDVRNLASRILSDLDLAKNIQAQL